MFKSQKGITLVALVITIIVMLILAGVSISLLLEDDGVINKALSVKNEQIKASFKEAVSLANAEIIMDYYSNKDAYDAAVKDADGNDDDAKIVSYIMLKVKANYPYNTEYPISFDIDTSEISIDINGKLLKYNASIETEAVGDDFVHPLKVSVEEV